jgi:acetyl esterase/lipase
MPLHPEAQALLRQFDALGDPPIESSTPEAVRALRTSRIRPPTMALAEIRDVDAGGVPTRLYRPSQDAILGLVVYFHGGGWVLGSVATHDHVARALAAESGCAVLSVDYRLAPEHPFPAGLDDAFAVSAWTHENARSLGCDSDRLAIGGDSAGANLAAVVTQSGRFPFRFQLLVYPVTDARGGTASYEELADGFWLTRAGMRWFLEHYLSGGEGTPDDPRVSPLLADDEALAASPPTLVITAELDPLRDEGEAYAERLRAAGVAAETTRYDGMIHGFFSFGEFLSDGRRAVTQAAEALAGAVGCATPAPEATAL